MPEKSNKNKEFTENYNKLGESPGFFSGCPEQEFHLEMKENLSKLIEDVDG